MLLNFVPRTHARTHAQSVTGRRIRDSRPCIKKKKRLPDPNASGPDSRVLEKIRLGPIRSVRRGLWGYPTRGYPYLSRNDVCPRARIPFYRGF